MYLESVIPYCLRQTVLLFTDTVPAQRFIRVRN